MNEDEVTISKERYKELLDSESFLCALQAAGVDNWSGYDVALDMIINDE